METGDCCSLYWSSKRWALGTHCQTCSWRSPPLQCCHCFLLVHWVLAGCSWLESKKEKNWLLTFWNILERQHFKRDSEDKLLDFTPPSRLEREMPAGLVCKPENWDNHWEGRKLKPNPKEERTNLSCCHPSHTRLLISMKNKKKRNTHWANSFYMLSPRLTFPVCNI